MTSLQGPYDDGGCSDWRDEDAGQGRTMGEVYDATTRAGWAFGLLLLGVVVAVIAWAVA